MGDQEGLLPDELVDEAVEEDEGGEGNDGDDDRGGRRDLAVCFRFLETFAGPHLLNNNSQLSGLLVSPNL